jgi:hypothetical protein
MMKLKRGSRDWWLAFAMQKLADRARRNAPSVTPVTLSVEDLNEYIGGVWRNPLKRLWYLMTARVTTLDFGDSVNIVDESGEITPLVKNIRGNYHPEEARG